MRAQIEEFQPHIIHAHGLVPAGLIAINHDRPTVVTAHGSDAYGYPYKRKPLWRAAEKVVKCADDVVAVSSFIADHIRALGAVNVRVIHNGADAKTFYPLERRIARSKLKIPANRHVILFAAHIEKQKGIAELVESLKEIRDLKPLLLVAGTGSMAHSAQNLLAEAGIDNDFYGLLTHSELAQVIGAADIVVLPSHREGLPAVICESMLAGRAVIASSVGGIPEIVQNGKTGLVVPPREVAPLSAALREVLTNSSLKEAMESNARQFAVENLTWAVNATQYTALYRQLISKREYPHAGDLNASC